MKYLKTFSSCLMVLALHSTAWAQIYETKDAEGNPEFTDSPATEGAEEVDLPETNLANPPPAESQAEAQAATTNVEQVPEQENNTVIVHDGNDNDAYDVDPYDNQLERDRAIDQVDPAAPREVLDGEAPREVGDSDAQMPREVGDSDSQMPHEVGDFPDATGAHRR